MFLAISTFGQTILKIKASHMCIVHCDISVFFPAAIMLESVHLLSVPFMVAAGPLMLLPFMMELFYIPTSCIDYKSLANSQEHSTNDYSGKY